MIRIRLFYLGALSVLALLLMSCDPEGINRDPPDYGDRYGMTSALVDPDKVVFLYLRNDTITVLPNELVLFRNMRWLEVNHCPLKAISPVFGELENLQSAKFMNCSLSEIPTHVFSVTKMTGLTLSNNSISILPDSICLLTNLVGLNLNDNNITLIPSSIVTMKNLFTLSLENNYISAMPDSLKLMTELSFLYLKGNPIPAKERLRIQAALPGAHIEF